MSDEHGDPIAYSALQPGTPIASSDGVELGTVERVIDNPREHIFDGIVMRAERGLVWVDAPEVARITIPSKMCSFALSITRSTVPSSCSSADTIGVPRWSAW